MRILTSDFHLKRAMYLARMAGVTNTAGIAVPCPALQLPQALLREVGAWWKLGIRMATLTIGGKKLY